MFGEVSTENRPQWVCNTEQKSLLPDYTVGRTTHSGAYVALMLFIAMLFEIKHIQRALYETVGRGKILNMKHGSKMAGVIADEELFINIKTQLIKP